MWYFRLVSLPALTTKEGRTGGWFACSSAASIVLIATKIHKARHKTGSRPKQTFLQRTQMTSKHGKMLNVVRDTLEKLSQKCKSEPQCSVSWH